MAAERSEGEGTAAAAGAVAGMEGEEARETKSEEEAGGGPKEGQTAEATSAATAATAATTAPAASSAETGTGAGAAAAGAEGNGEAAKGEPPAGGGDVAEICPKPGPTPQGSAAGASASASASASDEPPLYSAGGYITASDGWWAHQRGQWLYNPADRAYFHLATGRLHLAPTDGFFVQLASAAPNSDAPPPKARDQEAASLRGVVRWFNKAKGFGFIGPAENPRSANGSSGDIFVHRNQIADLDEGEVFGALRPGAVVSFALGETDAGRPCAVRVRVLSAEEAAQAERPAKKRRLEGDDDQEEEGDECGSDVGSPGSSVEVDVFEDLRCGLAQEKGPQKDQCEDFAVEKLRLPIQVLGETATCVFFAVFDGHGGSSCAEYSAAHLAKNVLSRLRDRAKNVSDEVSLKAGLMGAFKQTEHNFLQHARRVEDRSGTTACTMTVFGPDDHCRLRLFLANAGDSRAVLGRRDGEAMRLTTDHKPNLPAERKRIETAGGGVQEIAGVWRCLLPRNRPSPILGLAVSRALGDKDFKGPDLVSAEPELSIHEVDWDEDEFVILGSDGIWDTVSDKEAVRLVQHVFAAGGDEQRAAQNLVAKALEKGSADDRTALVVRFGWLARRVAGSSAPPAGARGDAGEPAVETAQAQDGPEEENDAEVAAAIADALAQQEDDMEEEGEEEEDDDDEADEVLDPTSTAAFPASVLGSSGRAGPSAPATFTDDAAADPPPPSAPTDEELDDIFASLGNVEDPPAASDPAASDASDAPFFAAGAAAGVGVRPVGMGLFDDLIPAAEEEGPALVGPRRAEAS